MKHFAIALALLIASPALSQSASLREAVRENRSDLLALATKEWTDCAGRCPEIGRLSLLFGVLKLSSGDPEAAATQLASIPAPAGLEAHHAYYVGEALFYSRRYANAATSFELALRQSTEAMRRRCQIRLGEALLADGKPGRALEYFVPAEKDGDSPELLFQKATAEDAIGRHKEARTDLKRLVLNYPTSIQAKDAYPKLRKTLALSERLVRARTLMDAGAADAALEELTDLAGVTRPVGERASIALIRAQAHYALGQDTEGEAALSGSPRWPKSLAAEALFLRARRALKKNDRAGARKLLADVATKFPKERPADEALYLLGWVDLQEDQLKAAAETLSTFSTRFPTSRKRDEAQWFLALAHLKAGNLGKAKIALDALIKIYPTSPLLAQAKYWAARSRELLKEPVGSWAPIYTQVIAEAPQTFYAQLANARLRAKGQNPPAFFPAAPKGMSVEMPGALKLFQSLEETGLWEDSDEELAFQTSAVKSKDALTFAHALQQLGAFGSAYQLGARYLWAEAFGQKMPEALAVLYPKAYAMDVEAAAKANAVDPFLLWAIMRRESAFRPEVQSGANARGLMQLIPPTATQISARLKKPLESADALFDPSLNVNLASWYVASLVKRFVHPSLVAAAYNAGPKPAAKWADERGKFDLDLFVETIPFKETRGYVKQVVADYYLYHFFYGDPATRPDVVLSLPAPHKEGVDF